MSAPATAESVLDLIRTELIESGVEEETISPDAKFDDLDIDSLDVGELMATVKRTYGVSIPRAELADVTVGQLAAKITEQAAS
ncbi:acyl carrier protein [Streptomyces sp. NPDC060184]|uniref:acyl carrier protein n=1 Tax=Streptomyces sp. NPDC060184 TaxID=3347064 RepID=UPI00365C3EFD